jgi:N-acetylmuramate 1-kinase
MTIVQDKTQLSNDTRDLCDNRINQIITWLSNLTPLQDHIDWQLSVASSDASFRRYFRVASNVPAPISFIVMDAPPEHENCLPFIDIANRLEAVGLSSPKILAQDLDQGFLLLSDLGTDTLLPHLNLDTAHGYYLSAINSLLTLQTTKTEGLAVYDEALLMREMQLFPTWYVETHCQATLTNIEKAQLDDIMALLVKNALGQPQVFVHRDFHSRNLMLPTIDNLAAGNTALGILDFQDAVIGPITYDLVSLLKDAYIEWDEELVLDWTVRYWEQARNKGVGGKEGISTSFGDFYRDFEWMGLQRHLKVLGIFARLNHRDGKAAYLNDIPLVLSYVYKVCERYNAFKPLIAILDRVTDKQREVTLTF